MPREVGTIAHDSGRGTKLAWLVSFLAPAAILLVLLAAPQPANSATLLPLVDPPVEIEGSEEEEEEEGEEVGGSEWEEADAEEGAEDELEPSPFPPEECLLRTARARLFTYSGKNQVRLVVRYTSFAAAQVTVDYWMKGKKGPLKLGHTKQAIKKKGLFRLTATLSDSEMAKVRAARSFLVSTRIPATPSYCERYYTRHLTIKRTVHNQVVWFQSDSIFGTGS